MQQSLVRAQILPQLGYASLSNLLSSVHASWVCKSQCHIFLTKFSSSVGTGPIIIFTISHSYNSRPKVLHLIKTKFCTVLSSFTKTTFIFSARHLYEIKTWKYWALVVPQPPTIMLSVKRLLKRAQSLFQSASIHSREKASKSPLLVHEVML